jgi:hypothetical protein
MAKDKANKGLKRFCGPLKCTCISEYQDKKYGKGLRIHNQAGTIPAPKYRCTVCLHERGL